MNVQVAQQVAQKTLQAMGEQGKQELKADLTSVKEQIGVPVSESPQNAPSSDYLAQIKRDEEVKLDAFRAELSRIGVEMARARQAREAGSQAYSQNVSEAMSNKPQASTHQETESREVLPPPAVAAKKGSREMGRVTGG